MYSVCNDLYGRVSPFGNLRIIARLPAPRSLSQATTSFVAVYRLGIHHVHLVTCPYNADLCLFLACRARLQFFAAAGIPAGSCMSIFLLPKRRVSLCFQDRH
jgi:hypothetical protein